MSNRRREIRTIVRKALFSKTHAEDRVFDFDIRPVQSEKMIPCINIMIKEETIDKSFENYQLIKRDAELKIIIYSLLNNENIIDDLCAQVEAEICGINSSDFLFELEKTEFYFDGLTVKNMLSAVLSYNCSYYTKEIPNITTDNLEEIGVEITHV